MSLQINVPLTTKSGLTVASGSYVWVHEERGVDKDYKVKVRLLFFINKVAFDQGRSRYYPQEIPDNLMNITAEFTPAAYGALTSLAVQTYVKTQLETVLGNGATITIVA